MVVREGWSGLRRVVSSSLLVTAPVVLLTAVAAGCVGATDATVVVTGAGRSAATTSTVPAAPPLPACVASMSLEQKAGQVLMVLVSSPAAAGNVVAAGQVAGYALVGSQSGDVAAAVAAVAAKSKFPVFASGDEEGGTVQRFRDLLGELPSAAALARDNSPEEAGRIFGAYGTKLKGLGLNMNFGPSLDVGGGSGLGTRSFGDSVTKVTSYGLAVIAAVQGAGLIPVAKHWPGIGAGKADPHTAELPIAGLATLRKKDLVPFAKAIGAGVGAIMVSHAIVPGLTDGLPASLSRAAITGELRGREHFTGLVVTDSLGMGAVAAHFDDATAAVVAVAAGADLALVSEPASVAAAHQGIVDAVTAGRITADQLDQSVGRVLRAKGVDACPA